MIKKFDYETSIQNRTFDYYNDVDCYNYSDVHDYIKFIKYGYGKVVDHAVREIRLRKMTRKKGIQLVEKYIFKLPNNLYLFLGWIGMTKEGFDYIINQHRNKNIWHLNDNWDWEIKDFINEMKSFEDKKYDLDPIKLFSNFTVTNKKESTDKKNKYILIGKGYK